MHSPVVTAFEDVLQRDGIIAALRLLNRRTAHRCSAIYRLQHLTVRSLYLYDREGAQLPRALSVVPLTDTFCQHAMRDGELRIEDSRHDPRVQGSPFKGVVSAYQGLPLLDRGGALWGSVCHFDFVPRSLPDEEFHILREAADVLPRYLP